MMMMMMMCIVNVSRMLSRVESANLCVVLLRSDGCDVMMSLEIYYSVLPVVKGALDAMG